MNPGSGGQDIDWSNYPNILIGYHLQPTSPCINTGQIITNNGGRDFWGNALYNGTPDIGAHEFTGGAQTIPSAPRGMSATPALSGQIDLGWTDKSNNENDFKIDRRTMGFFTQK
ncbi:hypothetical protein QQ008_23230 [Fulvivirgaceae bacterium BMA10]|uniref:Uncharacterized protein n=1 Tax=Splendidivirga corallicola TaxID=3051826 RepID=A0ABT8KU95_9BACT|nr:hypothetical protein [Fulvivirgaceae bacterium BMA10]